MESRFVEANGVRMRWEESGEGPPVVFVHGIPTSPRLWRHVMPRVEGRALAWEMVGYGSSIREGWDRDISVARQAEYLADWMRGVGLEGGAVVVGHDLGGGVAQILAVRQPDLVRGLVLTNAICYDSWPIPSVKAMLAAGPLVERLPDAVVRFNLYAGLFLRGHDDRARAKESLAEHWPYYAAAGGRRPSSGKPARSTSKTRSLWQTRSRTWRCPPAWCGARPTSFRRSATATGSPTNLGLRSSASRARSTSCPRIIRRRSRRR